MSYNEKQTVLPSMYFCLIFKMHLGVHPSISPLLTSLDCSRIGKNQRRRMEGRPIIVYDEPDITKPSPGKLSQLTNQNNRRLNEKFSWMDETRSSVFNSFTYYFSIISFISIIFQSHNLEPFTFWLQMKQSSMEMRYCRESCSHPKWLM